MKPPAYDVALMWMCGATLNQNLLMSASEAHRAALLRRFKSSSALLLSSLSSAHAAAAAATVFTGVAHFSRFANTLNWAVPVLPEPNHRCRGEKGKIVVHWCFFSFLNWRLWWLKPVNLTPRANGIMVWQCDMLLKAPMGYSCACSWDWWLCCS